MTVRLFEDANALDSLRNSDFDAVSAYGEVIDNSIEAHAKNIHVVFQPAKGDPEQIACVAFADDGDGMDAKTLHQCLKIGWSSRYNQRNGIGRFGVGMTMAATLPDDPLYVALASYADALAVSLVERLPDYQAADWS